MTGVNLAWSRDCLAKIKAIAAFVLFILGITGISLYGNVNEMNPWKTPVEELIEDEVIEPVSSTPQIKIIETRVESGITKLQVDAAIEAYRIKDL